MEVRRLAELKKRGRPAKPKTADTQEQAATQAVSTKRNWVPNPQNNFGEENVEPGDNSRFLRYAMVSMDLPPIDISDETQVERRIGEYFAFCIENDRKPNMIGMSNWIGVDRTTVKTWMTGEYRGSTHSTVIKKAVSLLEELWVDYMQNGKVNPASGIFLGKNMFGYKDVQDVVLTPNNPLGDAPSQKQLEEHILNSLPNGGEVVDEQ